MGFRRRRERKKRAHKAISQVNDSSKKEEGGEEGGVEFSLAPSFLIRLGQGRRIFSLHFPVSQKYIWQRDSHGKLDITSASSFARRRREGPFFKKVVPNEISRKFERGKSVDLLRLDGGSFPASFSSSPSSFLLLLLSAFGLKLVWVLFENTGKILYTYTFCTFKW